MSDIQQDTQNPMRGTGYRKVGKSGWWDLYDKAVTFLEEHGHTDFPSSNELYNWKKQVIAAWNRHSGLEPEQIFHIKKLGIDRSTVIARGSPSRTGKNLDEFRQLHQKLCEGTIKDEEKAVYDRRLAELASKYRMGHLSEKTAAEFGICSL